VRSSGCLAALCWRYFWSLTEALLRSWGILNRNPCSMSDSAALARHVTRLAGRKVTPVGMVKDKQRFRDCRLTVGNP
jgi:hypothetical protein